MQDKDKHELELKSDENNRWFGDCLVCEYESPHFKLPANALSSIHGHEKNLELNI